MVPGPDSKDAGPEYKSTLNLPDTAFPMKADLAIREPEAIARWNEKQIYQKMIRKNEGRRTFAMPDGPPYANGNLHMGHALNKILKDIVIKYRNMAGLQSVFIPGWDCHGLPIEQGVLKNLGSEKAKDKTEAEIRDLCRQEAKKWVGVQRDQFVRYGVLGDWDHPYLTLDPSYESEEVRTLAKILKTGAFYRGEKPVYWCLPLQTALAEAEVEYKNHKSPSIYVKFPVREGLDRLGNPTKPVSFVIWTTTPWTLPANLAVCLHPDLEYALYDTGSEYYVLAKGLAESVAQALGKSLTPGERTWRGSELEGMKARHCFYDRESPIVLGEHVTLEAGTGCVHTAPGHGQDDYFVGLKYGLKILSPVDERGCYTDEVPEYKGIKVFDANPKVVERLRENGNLLLLAEIEHSYPHCWRSKTPLIFRATPQWFLSMDKAVDLPGAANTSIRSRALQAIEQVRWIPGWGINRITGMIGQRPDWCLSRQRTWGVPIPVFYCKKCRKELAKPEIMERVADAMEKDGGIEAYHSTDSSKFTGGFKCESCGGTEFDKGRDILDVWFDSGVCFSAVQARRKGLTQPADLYLEGSDQHRGWFHTSLLASVAADGKAPFKTVLTHGFVMFAKGQKMSKSLGNVVDPQDIIKKSGAEILRLWAAHEDYSQDLTCSPESFSRLSETYRRHRNTLRFLLGNLKGFDPEKQSVVHADLMEVDRWVLARAHDLVVEVTAAYENYEFYKVYHALNNFATVELSAIYLDVLKDRLYTWKKDGLERRAAQTTLVHLLKTLTGLMAPILSFLADEAYQFIPGRKLDSVFLEDFPKPVEAWKNPELLGRYEKLLDLRGQVSKKLEELRQAKTIGSSLEAQITVQADGELYDILKKSEADLPALFIVSQVQIKKGPAAVETSSAEGTKCARCWRFDVETGKNQKHPGTCPRCADALS